MKFKIWLLTIAMFPLFSLAQGIRWETSLKEAFDKAKQQKKDVFIEFYSPTCPYCKELYPILDTKEVADFYNTNFINYRIDTQTPEAQSFVDEKVLDVYAIPFFLFFDSNGKILHAREVSANVNSVLQPAKMTLERTYAAINYPERFAKGEAGENFLSQYALFARVSMAEEVNRKVMEKLWNEMTDDKRKSQTSWVYAKKLSIDSDNPFANYWLKNHAQALEFEGGNQANFENAISRLLYGTLFSEKSEQFKAQDWKNLSELFSGAMDPKLVFENLWEKQLDAMVAEKDENGIKKLAVEGYDIFKNNANSKAYFMDKLKSKTDNLSEELIKWISLQKIN